MPTYDDDIAPELLRLAQLAQSMGLSFVAYVAGKTPEDGGRTVAIAPGTGFAPLLVELASRVDGNVDALMIGLVRHAQKHGPGTSIVLARELRTASRG